MTEAPALPTPTDRGARSRQDQSGAPGRLAAAALVGVFFGYYPTRRASLMNPIDALRYE
jgi:hypothetical protein